MICAPVASASAVTSSPPTTSDSLLASARSMPSPSVATVGPRPGGADERVEDEVGARLDDEPHEPLRADEHLAVGPRLGGARRRRRRRPARSGRTPRRCACATSASHERSADRPTSSSSPDVATISSACVPIEPVEPRMRRRRGMGFQGRARHEAALRGADRRTAARGDSRQQLPPRHRGARRTPAQSIACQT